MVKEWSTFQTRKHLICISLTLRVIVPAVLPPFVDTKNYHRDYSATYSFISHIICVSFTLNQSIDESMFHLLRSDIQAEKSGFVSHQSTSK